CVSRPLQRNPLLNTDHRVNIVVMRAWQRSGISPEASAVMSLMTSGRTGTSRRTVLRGVAAAGALAATGVFTGCGMPGTRRNRAECRAPDRSDSDRRLVVSNWPLYIDVSEENESLRPTLELFSKRSGISVTYQEDINDNNEFFGKVRNQAVRVPADRARHHRVDRLDGRATGATRLGAAAGQGQVAQRRS